MTYAHCAMHASIPQGADEALSDALLDVILNHPLAGEGVYVVALFGTEAISVTVARSALTAGIETASVCLER